MTLAAYFYPATKAQKARGATDLVELHELDNGARKIVRNISVENRREAHKVAAAHGAKPWNF
jgi:hypothetical protein